MCTTFLSFLCTIVIFQSNGKGLSYPKEQCDWIGVDKMHGPYLPIGVCKHIFNPNNLSIISDDHRYSQRYVCSEDGTVHARTWGNNTSCEGDHYGVLPVKIYGDDYYGCSASNNGPCPYTVVRFYHQKTPNEDSCIKSDDGWYSEAPNTVYQCLNNSHGWYMLQCTEDGKGLIGIDYTQNCEEILNETVFYDGCNYKDKYIEIMHCDYWNGNGVISTTRTTSMSAITSTTTASMSTITSTVSAVDIAFDVMVTNTQMDNGCDHEHHGDHHHGHHDHPGYDQHNAPPERLQQNGSICWNRLFMIAAGFGVVFMIVCCVTCRYRKQKRQIAEFNTIVDSKYDNKDTMGEGEDGEATTICLDEGETITFE